MHYYNSSTDKNFINNQTLVEDAKAILVNYYLNISQNAKIIIKKNTTNNTNSNTNNNTNSNTNNNKIVIQIEQIIITLIHIEKKNQRKCLLGK